MSLRYELKAKTEEASIRIHNEHTAHYMKIIALLDKAALEGKYSFCISGTTRLPEEVIRRLREEDKLTVRERSAGSFGQERETIISWE